MTVVRIDVDLDEDRRAGVLDVLRAHPDVTSVTTGASALELDLAGYAPDAAQARAVEVLRTVTEETGIDPGALRVVPPPGAGPGGQGA